MGVGGIAEEIDRRSLEDQAEVKSLAVTLREALRTAADAAPTGIDLGRLEAAPVQLDQICGSARALFSWPSI
jgi:hypothetical protein